MLWTALLLSASATQPTVDDLKSAAPSFSDSCIMFTNGVCICTAHLAETIEIGNCVEDEATGTFTCSYNVLFHDVSGLEGRHWEQRTDVFRRTADGSWKFESEARDAVIYDSFNVPRSTFAKAKAKNPRRSLARR